MARKSVLGRQGQLGLGVRNIKKRLNATGGTDPIFAAVDSANCPDLVSESETSGALYGGLQGKGKKAFKEAHSLLLTKGLIRLPIPLPDPAMREFTITNVEDPTDCNFEGHNEKVFNTVLDTKTGKPVLDSTGQPIRIISVFRRPVISTNLTFKLQTIAFGPPTPSTSIMWDGREPSLQQQAINATLGHAQAKTAPTPTQIEQMVQFETEIFSAQLRDKQAGRRHRNRRPWAQGRDAGAGSGPAGLHTHLPTRVAPTLPDQDRDDHQ